MTQAGSGGRGHLRWNQRWIRTGKPLNSRVAWC